MLVPWLIVGIALLTFGRKAFWMFVGGIGFLVGIQFATQVVRIEADWLVLAIAVVAGLAGGLLALLLQGAAVGLAGFVAGGLLLLSLVEAMGWTKGSLTEFALGPVLAFVAGGILGAILLGVLFDWALIVLSSVIGALMLSEAVPGKGGSQPLLFAILVVAGIVVQGILLRRDRGRRPILPRRSLRPWR
jgi:hypothetical protein